MKGNFEMKDQAIWVETVGWLSVAMSAHFLYQNYPLFPIITTIFYISHPIESSILTV